MNGYKIGEISRQLELSVDTLRYYEKIGLLSDVPRARSGIRRYRDKDISRLKFIKRAQQMNFTLSEISNLLLMQDDPLRARNEVRELTVKKLAEINVRFDELKVLRKELMRLVRLCSKSNCGCPILENLDQRGEKILKS